MILEALSVAYAAGLSPYATVALIGLVGKAGWVDKLPGGLETLQNPWIIGGALALAATEFIATLIPWVASAWDSVHTAIRPPAAAALAVATAWHADPALIALVGVLGGTLGLTTHLTKLGLRFAVDSSPEPVTNGLMNTAELGVIASVSYFVWNHPGWTLFIALVLLVAIMLAVRAIWKRIRSLIRSQFGQAHGAAGS
jgi:hypothetical protein